MIKIEDLKVGDLVWHAEPAFNLTRSIHLCSKRLGLYKVIEKFGGRAVKLRIESSASNSRPEESTGERWVYFRPCDGKPYCKWNDRVTVILEKEKDEATARDCWNKEVEKQQAGLIEDLEKLKERAKKINKNLEDYKIC